MTPMPFKDFETAYEALAVAIDQVSPEAEALFLAKLSLTLAHMLGDLAAFREAIEIARQDLSPGLVTHNV